MIHHSPEYRRRLKSRAWRHLCQQLIRASHDRCERCGTLTWQLEVHHKHYDCLGRERPQDLEVLCRYCHIIADNERREAIGIRPAGV
jgi:5-methylcytosine-specific restriction endonuclease McrA